MPPHTSMAFAGVGRTYRYSRDDGRALSFRFGDGLTYTNFSYAPAVLVNGEAAYLSSADAISRWPETATAIGLSLDARGALRLLAPHGVEDLLGLKVVPTAHFRRSAARMQMFKRRLVGKRWAETWPKLEIFCG